MTDFNTLGNDELGANKIARSATAFSLYNNPVAIARARTNAPKIVSAAIQQRATIDVGRFTLFGWENKIGFIGGSGNIDGNFNFSTAGITADTAVAVHPSGFVARKNAADLTCHIGSLRIFTLGAGSLGTVAKSSLAFDDDANIYGGSTGNTLRKWSVLGSEIWSIGIGSNIRACAIRRDGAVFATNNNGSVYRIDQPLDVPAVTWSQINLHSTGDVRGLAIDLSGNIYTGGTDNVVRKLNPETGATIWTYSAASNVESIATGPNGALVIGLASNPRLVALNKNDGTVIWSTNLDGTRVGNARYISIRPDGKILVSGSNGSAIVMQNGTLLSDQPSTAADNGAQLTIGIYPYFWDETDPEAP
jgi:outer membrane protein assembly factor BamB